MPFKPIISLLCLTTLLSACCDNPEPPLQGCCDIPGIHGTVGNAHVYVPNIFTPNGDGHNDYLFAYGDLFLVRLVSFQIRDKEGQVVFQALDQIPNDPISGWDGTINGVLKEGLYNITIQAEASDGTIGTLEGKVCNYPCKEMIAGEPISAQGCQFPSQVTDGYFDPTIPTNEESDCFE